MTAADSLVAINFKTFQRFLFQDVSQKLIQFVFVVLSTASLSGILSVAVTFRLHPLPLIILVTGLQFEIIIV